jgi:hypothetical protein
MSFRFGADATGNARVSRTGGAPDPQGAGGWTVCGWWYLSADRNDFSTMIRLHSGSGSTTRLTLATKTDGTTPAVFTPGNTGGVSGVDALTVGSWLFIAVVQSGTTATIYTCTSVGGTLHSASGTSSGGSAPDGYTIGGRAASDSTEWFNGRGRFVRQWSGVQLTPTEVGAERDSTTAVKAGAYSDHPLATGTDLSDVSGNTRTLTAGSVAGTTEADPPIGTSAVDTLTGVRIGQLTDTAAATIARADTIGGARAASLADTAAVGVSSADQIGGARAGAPPDAAAVGIARADALGAVRAASLPEVISSGLVLPDLLGGVRAYGLPDSTVTALQAPDTLGSVRVGNLTDQPRGTLVLLDVIGHARVAPLADTAAAGLALADTLSAARVAELPNPEAPPALALAVPLGSVRVAGLAVTPTGGESTLPRDIAVSARLLPSRAAARILPSRWLIKEVP